MDSTKLLIVLTGLFLFGLLAGIVVFMFGWGEAVTSLGMS